MAVLAERVEITTYKGTERHNISPESLLGAAWVVQGAAAIVCFLLAVRWLRS